MTSSTNFQFLVEHDERLVALAGLAERYFRDDPPTAIFKLRQFAELSAKIIAARQGAYRDERETFEETLRRLSYERIIPREVADIFHALRKTGNAAVHEDKGGHAEALTALKFARSLGVWFHRTYGRQSEFSPGPFIPPPEPVDATAPLREEIEALRRKVSESEDAATAARREAGEHALARESVEDRLRSEAEERRAWEQLAQETEAEKVAIDAKLASLQAEAEAAPRAEINEFVERGEQAATKLDLDEAETRALIDQQLRDNEWEADTKTLRYSLGVRPAKGRNMAIAEWPTANGPADYALFVGTMLVGVVEAKRRRKNVSAAIDQAERYSFGIKASGEFVAAGGPWGEHRVPFVFAANGRSYLKQIETESGIWFRDTRRSANLRRALVDWLTPDGLTGLLEVDQDAADAALKSQPFDFGFPLRPYQEGAIRAVEAALSDEHRSMLVAMATGTGKTKLAIALLYRLLSAKRFRRICFVVDRSALGHQTEGEFSTTKVVSGKTFAEIFGLKGLGDVSPDVETKVHICTIQGMVKRVLFAADASEAPSVDQYDLMVIDECHRGYLLDREMSDTELSFRGQDDYISKYRRVLEYFDAVKIGLTATPALHTTDIFGEPIFRYSYREAVIDGFMIDHEPPIRIETALARAGIRFEKDEQLDLLDTKSGKIDTASLPDELHFDVEKFNKQVITPEFNRVVAEELAKHIDPALPGKTLIFAATDAHADIVVDAIKTGFADAYGEIDDAAVKKITGSVDKAQNLIRSFRNDANPQIVVTVDLLTTGIDVPKITNLVFLRRVNSRILYEQMIGRATRQCPDISKEVFRIFDAVDLYPHLQNLTDMKPVVINPAISFEQLVGELIGATEDAQRETIREQIAVKLRRRLKKLPDEARERFEAVAGETPEAMLQRVLSDDAPDLAAWLQDRAAIGPILDWQVEGENPRYIPISHHDDEVVAVTRGYGDAEKPEDFLDSFTAFVRDNINTITALKLVVQRPRELTRADLKELRLALDRKGYSEANLRRAWADARNEEIAASIIGFVRQAAIGDPLMPYEDRVRTAMRAIIASRQWTEPQKRWLKRIGEQIEKEVVVDREAIDKEPFIADGGFTRLNKVFGGELESLLAGINEENVEEDRLMTTTTDIVAKLWGLCNVLRDDGVTYNEYVTELTYLLFLKMLAEVPDQNGVLRENRLPEDYRWGVLAKREGMEQLDYYKALLLELSKATDGLVRAIFVDAQTRLRKPTNLKALTSNIDQLDWFSAREEGLGNLYEGLLEKNASDKKSGAGQYFTPRPLIDCIVRLMQPTAGETVQDPAAGTAGFLVAADRYIKVHTDDLYKLSEAQAFFQRHNAFVGSELVPDTHRLCMMNLLLHGIEGGVDNIDTLSPDGETLARADLVLTNPPFGTKKGGGRPTRSDFSVTADTSNKQLAFVEHIVRALNSGGRAAVIVPDNVLFEDNTGRRLRTWMMDLTNLHTILRLPTGIFYAQGVKTNVLFFQRGKTDKGNTKAVWVYDMRANMPAFGKTRPLTVGDFADFEAAYGEDPNGGAEREDQGEEGRWRRFSRDAIAARNDNLDIAWLRDTEAEAEETLTEPEDIAAAIIGHLKAALSEIEALSEQIEPESVEESATVAVAAE